MKDRLVQKLTGELGYGNAAAKTTAGDLLGSGYEDIRRAAELWVTSGTMTDIRCGGCSVRELVTGGRMTYPAALVYIDWLRTEPEKAAGALRAVM
ncbi:MAG: hypothetical protein IKN17_11560 [Ruminococcus sp.]|nr:hypothetical protein [Ruminococcus sp.]